MDKAKYMSRYHVNVQMQDFFFFCACFVRVWGVVPFFIFSIFSSEFIFSRSLSPSQECKFMQENCNSV